MAAYDLSAFQIPCLHQPKEHLFCWCMRACMLFGIGVVISCMQKVPFFLREKTYLTCIFKTFWCRSRPCNFVCANVLSWLPRYSSAGLNCNVCMSFRGEFSRRKQKREKVRVAIEYCIVQNIGRGFFPENVAEISPFD